MRTVQAVVHLGRDLSALFAVLAALAFAAAAWRLRGWGAALAALLITGLSHTLLINAHYMKEDCALVLGIATVFAAQAWVDKNHWRRSAILLGVSCAIAASAKYIGFIMIVFAVGTLVTSLPQRWKALAWFAASFVILFAFINTSMLFSWTTATAGLFSEVQHVAVEGHNHTRHSFFSSANIVALERQLIWPVTALALLYYVVIRKRRLQPAELSMALFPPVYFALISLALVFQPRYLLPVSVSLHFLAALGLIDVLAFIRKRLSDKTTIIAWAAVLGIVVVAQGIYCAKCLRQFALDSRYELHRWIAANAPWDAHLATDALVGLHNEKLNEINAEANKGIQLTRKYMVGELGSLEEARKLGITHVATCDLIYQRFFDPDLISDGDEWFAKTRAFYQELFREGKVVWQQDPDPPLDAFTNPRLRVFDIRVNQ